MTNLYQPISRDNNNASNHRSSRHNLVDAQLAISRSLNFQQNDQHQKVQHLSENSRILNTQNNSKLNKSTTPLNISTSHNNVNNSKSLNKSEHAS